MSVRVRFAPSPTGHLHVGGARTALYNYLFARVHGGAFVLRIEDTDAERSTEAATQAILDGLRWLGLAWDEGPIVGGTHGPYLQSERQELYRKDAERLVAMGRAYPCWCTPEELEARREQQLARGEDPRYDGRCRRLTAEERAARAAVGARAALRFALPEESQEVAWDDLVRGRVSFRSEVLDDFVLLRADGLPTYNFACVVDDLAMAITHVIRGDDHISNTPRQILLYRALGAEPPVFAHASMILGPDGKRLSKRHGATSVEAFGEQGIIPEGMVNFLALLGWALDGQTELFSLAELEQVFQLERVNPNPAVFDTQKLEWINAQHLKRLAEPDRVGRVMAFLSTRGHRLADRGPEWCTAFVRALGDRVRTLADAEDVGAFVLHDPPRMEAAAWDDLLGRAGAGARLEALAQAIGAVEEWSLAAIEAATRGLATTLGIKAGELITPARIALTGRTAAPGIFDVMGLLGREKVVARLVAAAQRWRSESPLAARV
jgi:nondiscriminating glutamyl-tRNA synthetase